MANKPKALFIVATQYDNLGDLIINKCLIDELANHAEVFLDLKSGKDDFTQYLLESEGVHSLQKEYGFSFRNLSSLKYFIGHRNEFKFLFKSPGPLPYKKKRPPIVLIRNWVFELIYSTYRKSGEIFIVGSEIALESKTLESRLKGLHNFKKILLRSKSNVAYISSLGFNNVDYIPDLCFLLRDKVNPNIEKDVIGISFRDLNNPLEDKSINSSTSTLVDFYSQRGKKIVFFYQVERDRDYTYNLYKKFEGNANVSFINECLNWDEIQLYEKFRVVISNRLHVILLGFIHNTITFSILNDNFKTRKIPGILESIGYGQDTYDQLTKSTLEATEANYDELVKKIDKINEFQLDLCKSRIAEIFCSN